MLFSDIAWYTGQLTFLQSHHYWTATMRQLRDRQKRQSIIAMQELLARASASSVRRSQADRQTIVRGMARSAIRPPRSP